jgi:hypothetical protein
MEEIPVESPVKDTEEQEETTGSVEAYIFEALGKAAKEQGVYEDLKKAFEEHEEVYVGTIREKVFAFRPLYWDEQAKFNQNEEELSDEAIVRLCVVAGLENVVGKRARAGIWNALSQRIFEVSDFETDYPSKINIPADKILG